MIRALLLGVVIATAPSAAIACQCDEPANYTTSEIEERARWLASRDFVIAEVERLPPAARHDQQYRVIRLLAGRAPDVIRVDRFLTRLANGQVLAAPITSCDYAAPPGYRRVMAFSRGAAPDRAICGVLSQINAGEALRPAGMCSQSDLDDPRILERVLKLMRR
jgi:hypothetical protein